MNQSSSLGFGSDASVLSGYAFRANDRLGNVDLVVENTGANTLNLRIKELVGTNYNTLVEMFSVAPGGAITKSLSLLSKQIGFFGSGSTTANFSFAIRNLADRRGVDVAIVPVGRQGWSYAPGFDQNAYKANLST